MIIDILLLLFVLGGFWGGYHRGIIKTLAMAAAYVTALLLTLKISPWLAGFLTDTFNMGKMFALIFGTIGLLMLLILLIHFIAKRASQSVKKGNLTTANKMAGGLIMSALSILFYSLLLWPLNQFGMIGEKAKQTSMSYSTLATVPETSKTFIVKLKPIFSRYWQLMEDTIDESKAEKPQ